MSGPSGLSARQEQQQMILNKAYSVPNKKVKKVVVKTVKEEIQVKEPDMFDNAYVMMRTIVPGWLLFLFIVVGGITVILQSPIGKIIRGIFRGWGFEIKRKTK